MLCCSVAISFWSCGWHSGYLISHCFDGRTCSSISPSHAMHAFSPSFTFRQRRGPSWKLGRDHQGSSQDRDGNHFVLCLCSMVSRALRFFEIHRATLKHFRQFVQLPGCLTGTERARGLSQLNCQGLGRTLHFFVIFYLCCSVSF